MQGFWVPVLAAALGISNADSNFDWEFCSTSNLCGVGQGDCDSTTECEGTLTCGTNNCIDFDSAVNANKDCCRESQLYDWNWCSTDNTCGVGEGDCDSDADCEGSLICGTDNCNDDVNPNKDCCKNIPNSEDGQFGGDNGGNNGGYGGGGYGGYGG